MNSIKGPKKTVDIKEKSIKFLICFIRNMLIMPEKVTYEDLYIISRVLSLSSDDIFELVDYWAKTDEVWLEDTNKMIASIRAIANEDL